MITLSDDKRQEIFDYLKLGNVNKTNIKKFQKMAFASTAERDGIFGPKTDTALMHWYNVTKYTKNFHPTEFKCECGGRYCSGYPDYMKPNELKNIQAIRDHWGKPITVTCGLRCKGYNKKLNGSIQNSKHLTGQAIDFYQAGVTDTLANRKKAIKWIKTLPNHTYTYGNGINSYGYSISAPYMGNALHTDTSGTTETAAPKPAVINSYDDNGKLICDGVGGEATVNEMQRFFGTPKDGIISGQNKTLAEHYPALKSVEYGKGGSPCIKNLQRWVGVDQDGVLGSDTVEAWQEKLGVSADGIFGTNSMKAWQKYLNENDKAVYPIVVETIVSKILKACAVQADWIKNSKYEYETNPTVEKSKKKSTCVTYVSCVLQRVGLIKSGQSMWHDEKDRVYGANGNFTVIYPKNKTLSQLKSELKAGDIVMDGHGVGSGSHIFILTGKWNGYKPVIWDNHSGQDGKGAYTYGRDRHVIAIVRPK